MTDRRFVVELTQGAEDDLEEIHGYLTAARGLDDADALLDELLRSVETLEQFPDRGAIPNELQDLGMREFRQILLRHYRLIYRVFERRVVILIIADGRRDMQTLLERRLLGRPH
ncbi:type II toxin-antitoxin system RelE/ParE family toxin [Novosphingobium sp. AP12]|uniref:type II toxin-antitoxin system RelE/ParE family toxin n=1 Tax=Novosphingobium sp. AP12 TaxID=1144305 RepID=UPI000271D8B1|nr:type II toxin-antitoxin system RelE/ParE family toxin [Novosphingobium sp. AP12]EJL29491.1 plasmid stabilization system protein [Novosphingobium sp. AP12]